MEGWRIRYDDRLICDVTEVGLPRLLMLSRRREPSWSLVPTYRVREGVSDVRCSHERWFGRSSPVIMTYHDSRCSHARWSDPKSP